MAEKRSSLVEDTSDREILVSRVFDAPRELVWKAWTDPEHVVHWWGPKGFTTTIHEMDVRPGGVWRHTMHGPDGTDYPNESVFIEVVRPERIVFSHGGSKKGESSDAQFRATWTFEEQAEKTKLTVRMVFPSAAAREHVVKKYGALEGAHQTFGRLAEHLLKMGGENSFTARAENRPLVITRVFDAPRVVVFAAWTKPEFLTRWWGPRGFTLPTCELDFHAGGAFRFVMRGPDGKDYPFDGVYLEIAEPERIVFRGTIHGEAGHEVLTTVTFVEQGGKTELTVHQVYSFQSEATRGAREGWNQTLDRLVEHLAQE